MNGRRRASLAVAVGTWLAMATSGCAAPGTGAADPTALLRQDADAMTRITTVTAQVSFGPGLVFQDLNLDSATTRIHLPSDSDTTIKVRQNDFLISVRVVTVGGQSYLLIPFAPVQRLTAAQAADVPDLGLMFDRQRGLPALLTAGRDAKYVGRQTAGGVETDVVGATYAADQVGGLLGGVQPAGDVRLTVWIGTADHLVHRARLEGPLVRVGVPTWVDITATAYNSPVTVAPPA